MSVTQQIRQFFDSEGTDVVVITESDGIDYDLGENYTVEVRTNTDLNDRPLTFAFYHDVSEEPYADIKPPSGAFHPGSPAADRYATIGAGFMQGEFDEEFRDVLTEIGEQYRSGRLLAVDDHAAKLIASTERVECDPAASQPWTVILTDDHVTPNWGYHELNIRRRDWVGDRPNLKLPNGLDYMAMHDVPGRWESVKEAWSLMYAEQTSATFGGDEDE